MILQPTTILAHAAAHAPPIASNSFDAFAENILIRAVDVGIIALLVAMTLCAWRMLTGPTLVDRALAGDTIAMQLVGLAILLTIRLRTLLFFDAVLIVSILGFASTVAFAQFIGRRRAV